MSDLVPFVRGLHTYQGSCHCKATRWEVDLDLSEGTIQCNCSWCTRRATWSVLTKPERFRLHTSLDALQRLPGPPFADRRVCPTCGFLSFSTGDIPTLGGAFVWINVRCLDGVRLDGVPVHHLDGKNNTWARLGTRPYVDPFATLLPAEG